MYPHKDLIYNANGTHNTWHLLGVQYLLKK